MERKKVLMVMPVMKGGGAERVAALLMNEFHQNGFDVTFLLTSTGKEDVICRDLNPEIDLVCLQEQLPDESIVRKGTMKLMRLYSTVFSRMFEAFGKNVPSHFAYWSFMSQYRKEIAGIRRLLEAKPDMTVISFLQPSIPMVLLAANGLPNRVIFSERGNPERLMKHRYGRNFIEKYYKNVNAAVFQTEEAKNTYPPCVAEKGVVIPNPIKSDLPEPFFGERNHNITTFCRISKQKNLPMLLEAFRLLHEEYPEYVLRIIGDTLNEEGEQVQKELAERIAEWHLEESVAWCPFSLNVHEEIREDCMYVNSSDYEGMSNAMLEAMAIGMPVICTDCPIGGAHAAIEDGANGLLVPVGDARAMYTAMKRLIEDRELAETISRSAAEIRKTLSLERIAGRWMELL